LRLQSRAPELDSRRAWRPAHAVSASTRPGAPAKACGR